MDKQTKLLAAIIDGLDMLLQEQTRSGGDDWTRFHQLHRDELTSAAADVDIVPCREREK